MIDIVSVSVNSDLYNQGVALRKKLFFENFKNGQELINDTYENHSIHFVAVEAAVVIGTGRLTYQDSTAIISQMTVKPTNQGNGIGSAILKELIITAQKNKKVKQILLNARVTAISFYKKHNFKVLGETFNSQKTGIPHQQMILDN